MKLLILCLLGFGSLTSYSQDFVPNQLLIQIDPAVEVREVIEKINSETAIEISNLTTLSTIMRIYQLDFNSTVNIDKLITAINRIPGVTGIQKNHYITHRVTIPNDTQFGSQWHLNNTGQSGGTIDADIDAAEAWDITTGGVTAHIDTIVVCIIEGGGVDINHEDLKDNIWRNYAEIPNNGIDDDNNGYVDDFNGWNIQSNTDVISAGSHGTRVAGMIGAVGNNSLGISGVNHQVKMMVVEGQQASNEASVIAAYTYPLAMRKKYNNTNGSDGAFVVATNASWGINNGDPANSPLWCAMYDSLGAVGIINIGATSNSNVNVDIVGDLPTTCPSDYLIGVTMTNSADQRAGSGYGPIHVDIAAPGSSVFLSNSGNTYNSTSGTSFATPCVAGAVALLYSVPCNSFIGYAKSFPDSAALKIRSLLLDNVDVIANLTGEVASDGRLNVNESVLALLSECDTNSCATPFNISMSNLSDTSVSINWSGFNNDNYFVTLTNANGFDTEINTSSDSITFYNLTPCANYSIQVNGICGVDTSSSSNIIEFQTDGCCNAPDLNLIAATASSLSFNWNSVLNASEYVIRYKEMGNAVWNYDTLISNTYLLENLDTCVDYAFSIKSICADSTRDFSTVYQFSTLGCGICFEGNYCTINNILVNTNFEWLESITLKGTTINSGNNAGYYDGGIITDGLAPNTSYTISFQPGYTGTQFTEHYSVWLDLDQNGTFEASEKLINNLTGVGGLTAMLIIPNTNIHGITKMRIGMNGVNSPSLCADEGGNIYGEYEDYCVQIGGNVGITNDILKSIHLYPNPTNDYFSINSPIEFTSIKVINSNGQIVQVLSPNTSKIYDISNLQAGSYWIQMMTASDIITKSLIKY